MKAGWSLRHFLECSTKTKNTVKTELNHFQYYLKSLWLLLTYFWRIIGRKETRNRASSHQERKSIKVSSVVDHHSYLVGESLPRTLLPSTAYHYKTDFQSNNHK